MTSDQPRQAPLSSISARWLLRGRLRELVGAQCSWAWQTHPVPTPPQLPKHSSLYRASQPPSVCALPALCVCVCLLPYFGPVVQRPLYLQSELSSITRPAPVTQRLLNGPVCADIHTCSPARACTQTHIRHRGQRHRGARPEHRRSDMHVNKQEVTAWSPPGWPEEWHAHTQNTLSRTHTLRSA